jgi:hypothetical protein
LDLDKTLFAIISRTTTGLGLLLNNLIIILSF